MSKSRYVEPNGYFSADMLKAFKEATKNSKSTGSKKSVKRTGKKK